MALYIARVIFALDFPRHSSWCILFLNGRMHIIALTSVIRSHKKKSHRDIIVVWPHYFDISKQHLGVRAAKQLFFCLTTTYWLRRGTQPSLAILLEVPGVVAKFLQLSLPYLILMSSLWYTGPCHYFSNRQLVIKRSFVSVEVFFPLLCSVGD